MVNYERITAEAAELARQFWLEIEAEFTQQIAPYQVDRLIQARMPGDDETLPSWPARPAAPIDRPAALYEGPATHAPMQTQAIDEGQTGPFAISRIRDAPLSAPALCVQTV